jgi:hypothetical protein
MSPDSHPHRHAPIPPRTRPHSRQTAQPIYRTRAEAIIARPQAVDNLNRLLDSFDQTGDWKALDAGILEEIHRGAMLGSWRPVQIELTGLRIGHLVEFRMLGRDGVWWSIAENIIEDSGISTRHLH